MTKVFALLSVAAVLAFASCAEKTSDVVNNDTTAQVPQEDTTAKVEAPKADSTADSSTTAPAPAPAEAPKAH